MAVFQRTVEVTLCARFRGKAPAHVQVGGTFSNWQLLDAAWDNDTKQWTARVRAARGVHMYKWFADGVWTLAEEADTTFDQAGNKNHALYV